ncbi:DUF1800 family protein [Zhongshania sp.]|uniref:DUF1800 domain-containing protein n=1 Tax=Zhongshania sp. TaxID=1971902 RepID=UPI003566DAB8
MYCAFRLVDNPKELILSFCLIAFIAISGCGGSASGEPASSTLTENNIPTTEELTGESGTDADPAPEPKPETDTETDPPTDDSAPIPVNFEAAFQLLKRATFGPVQADIDQLMSDGIETWVNNQLTMPSAYTSTTDGHLTHLERLAQVAIAVEPQIDWYPDNTANDSSSNYFDGRQSGRTDIYQMSVWFENALHGPDQLRQRVAYALSQILVASTSDPELDRHAEALAHYYDILARNAFGNFRTLLGEVAKSPAMGTYLSHQGNEKTSADGLTLPDENFARELMQLFTIGLYQLNGDGSPKLVDGNLVPNYSQTDIEEMAKVMTGWDLRYNNRYGRTNGSYVHFMEFNPEHHDLGDKLIMGSAISDDGAGGDLEQALDLLFQHPSAGPFIGKQLIQRLVTSNPTPQYIARVSAAFNDDGHGIRGNLSAVIRAILFDPEAERPVAKNSDQFGKVDEHLLAYTRFLRSFKVRPIDGWRLNADTAVSPVNGIYSFNNVRSLLGQAPLRAHHVFNFYDPDYVPQDSYYRDASPQRVLPEMQLRSANNIANLFELTLLNRNVIEINELNRSSSLAEYVESRNAAGNNGKGNWNGTRALAVLDYSEPLKAFELATDGDTNGNFSQINSSDVDENGFTAKQRGLDALLSDLEHRMLGGIALDPSSREDLIHYLDTDNYFNTGSNNKREAIRVTAAAIQYVFISSANMVQQ